MAHQHFFFFLLFSSFNQLILIFSSHQFHLSNHTFFLSLESILKKSGFYFLHSSSPLSNFLTQEAKEEMSQERSFFNTTSFSSLLLADLLSLTHFIYSQPLYFAYIIVFFPFFLQLLLFLCPLLSTSLLLVALLTASANPTLKTLNWRCGLFSFACKTVLDVLETRIDDEVMFHLFEPLASMASKLEVCMEFEAQSHQGREDLIDATRGQCQCIRVNESAEVINSSTEKGFVWKIEETFKDRGSSNNTRACANPEVMSGAIKNSALQPKTLDAGEEFVDFAIRNHTEDTQKDSRNCDEIGLYLKGYGSNKREKEWKSTLAGKLYEERLSARRAEEMDLLWEVYEADSGIGKEKNSTEATKKGKLDRMFEEEEIDGQLCCLEAIRFSAMKVNLGVKRHSLVKISKALKGVGLFVKRKGKNSN